MHLNLWLYTFVELGAILLKTALIIWFISSYLGCRFQGGGRFLCYGLGILALFLALTANKFCMTYDGLYMLLYVLLAFLYLSLINISGFRPAR